MAQNNHAQDTRTHQGNCFPANFPPTPFDRFADTLIKFLDNMPSRTLCEASIAAGLNGFSIPPCQYTPTVCDIASEFEFCWDCWRRFMRGDWDAR